MYFIISSSILINHSLLELYENLPDVSSKSVALVNDRLVAPESIAAARVVSAPETTPEIVTLFVASYIP